METTNKYNYPFKNLNMQIDLQKQPQTGKIQRINIFKEESFNSNQFPLSLSKKTIVSKSITKTLTQFPPSLFEHKELKEISLSKNNIKVIKDLTTFKYLQKAFLNNNSLQQFPLFPKSLIVLKISCNQIKKIPQNAIENLVNLEILHIDRNLFRTLPTNLYKLEKLKEFALEWFRYVQPSMELI